MRLIYLFLVEKKSKKCFKKFFFFFFPPPPFFACFKVIICLCLTRNYKINFVDTFKKTSAAIFSSDAGGGEGSLLVGK